VLAQHLTRLPPLLLLLLCHCTQVHFKVYESAELQPYLDAANAEKEAGGAAAV
jgi:hypothetical protein